MASALLVTGAAGPSAHPAASAHPSASARLAAAPYPAAAVELIGHGWGHGRGMGQFGALGYALGSGWTDGQILDHYYGGTTLGHVPTSTLMTVDMQSRDGLGTIVVQERGELTISPSFPLGCGAGSPCAVRIDRIAAGTFRVSRGTSCTGGPGGWVVVAASVSATAITAMTTAGATDNRTDMLQLCEANATRWLRGRLIAQDTSTTQATVNQLPIEDYVRGVVPRESPAFWGSLGNGAGEQALKAQAVAARSYGLAESRWPYAQTCDTTSCQAYGGRAVQSNGTFTDLEGTPVYASSDTAVSSTAGEVRVFGPGGSGAAGSVARTEFSSSTGGYTAGGTFPAVVDDGDATASNPNHNWTHSIAVSDIEAAYPGRGSLSAVNVTARNGLGGLGGRVLTIDLVFAAGDVSVTGDTFAATFGLRSNWFAVTNAIAPVPYNALTADGTVYGFGGAAVAGSLASRGIHATAVGLAEGPGGYWVLTADGSVYAFGSVTTYGSVASMRLNGPPHQIMATPSGKGYWIIASDGGVFSFGDAHFFGSTGGRRLNAPIVGVGPTPDGGGYWLLGSDGGIFSFGDAQFYGSTGGLRLNAPVNALAPMPDGHGYWLAAADGGIFSFGSASFAGSLPGRSIRAIAIGIQATPTGHGYLIATSSGFVYGFGDAVPAGGPADIGGAAATVGIAVTRG